MKFKNNLVEILDNQQLFFVNYNLKRVLKYTY
jgi:hypothetical protein